MKRFGFFKELPHGDPNGCSLASMVQADADLEEEKIISYLSSGICLAATPGLGVDPLAEEKVLTQAPHIVSDGEWVWPEDLVYYVATYHVRMPVEFKKRMRESGFKVLSFTEEETLALSNKLYGGLGE